MSDLHKLYAIKDASDVLVTDIATGVPVMLVDYANTFSINLSSETQYSQSKGRNSVAFSSPFEGTLTTEIQHVSLSLLAMLLGSEVVSSASGDLAVRESVVVSSAGTVELQETPKTGSIMIAQTTGARQFLTVGALASPTEVTVSGKTITFDDSHKGDPFMIFYIKESAQIDKITVYATPKTKAYKMSAFTSIKAVLDSSDEDLNITLFKVSPRTNSELTFDASSPSSFTIEWDILSTEDGRMLDLTKAQ